MKKMVLTPGLKQPILCLLATLFLFSSSMGGMAQVQVQLQEKRAWEFPESGVRFHNQFSGARLNECTQVGSNQFRILIRPENTPVNNSPWFAFQVTSKELKEITVTLAYENGTHRYHPKISADGLTWRMLGANAYRRDRERNQAILKFDVGPKPTWIASQELIRGKEINGWMDAMTKRNLVEKKNVGKSMQGRAIDELVIGDPAATNFVFIIGRQHPPEVTGTLGLIGFTETLTKNSRLATAFRKNFRTIVIPLVNPDGVEHGQWRHNLGGVDLNRDWNKFVQPETTLIRRHLSQLGKASDARVFLMLDFHSTQEDIFYTQTDAEKTFPADFTKLWLKAIQDRFPDYKVVRSASHDPNGNTSKVWGFLEFGAPCITYELGDSDDRSRIQQITSGAAEEMMKMFLGEIGKPIK